MASPDVRRALREKFPPEKVKQRQGPGGKKLDYVAGETVIERLIEATQDEDLGYAWAANTAYIERIDNKWSVVVTGALVIGGDQGTGMGSMTHADLDMAVKSANTEALKNAAKNGFGVGLELWDAEYRDQLGQRRRAIAGTEADLKALVWRVAQQRDPEAKTATQVAKLFDVKAGDLSDPDVLRTILTDEGLL